MVDGSLMLNGGICSLMVTDVECATVVMTVTIDPFGDPAVATSVEPLGTC